MFHTHFLLEKIQQIQEEKESGFLFLQQDAKIIRVFFHEGFIDALSSNLEQHRLGQYLVREGFVEASAIDPLLQESQRRQIPLGEAAVRRKILDPAELRDVARRQAVQLLKYAIDDDFAVGSFERPSPSFQVSAQIDLDYLRLELARNNSETFELGSCQLVVLRDGMEISALPWYPQELSVLGQLTQPRTPQELVSLVGMDYTHLKKILSVLQNLQLIEVVEAIPNPTTALALRERFPLDFLVPAVRNAAYSDKLEIIHDECSFVSEQFKTLKARLNEIPSDRSVKAIVISSPLAADGKSLISINLALCFAKDPGRRVIVVDCDLRNPSLHKYLGIPPEPGLLGFLQNGVLQPHCYMRRLENLYLMMAGGTAANPVELLSQGKMRGLIEYLKTEFDTIILDSPPLAPISDGRILTGLADGLIMVVRCGKTSYTSVERALKVIDWQKFLGVVFNDVKPVLFHTQYDYSLYHYASQGLYPRSRRRIKGQTKNYLDH
jgi:protein-tyrosine kinase